jgi:hypothetical protein
MPLAVAAALFTLAGSWVATAENTQPPPPPPPPPGRCVDPYADKVQVHDDGAAAAWSLPTASNNSACVYSCAGLAHHLGIPPTLLTYSCYIYHPHQQRLAGDHDGHHPLSSTGGHPWPPPLAPQNRTHTTAGASAITVVQGRMVRDFPRLVDEEGGGAAAAAAAAKQPSPLLSFSPLMGRMDAVGGASLVLRHVEMSGLVAIAQPSCYHGFACGGAIFVSGGGNLTVEHAFFRGNRAGPGADGGAIKVIAAASVQVRYTTFTANQANFGGALNLQGCGRVEVDRCVLEGNSAGAGGGMRVNLGGPGAPPRSSLRITECEFARNSGTKEGGAFDLFMRGGTEHVVSVVDCRGAGNTEPAIYQAVGSARGHGAHELAETDVLLSAAGAAMNRWGLVSFRTTARGEGACQLPPQPPMGTRPGVGCGVGAVISNGSSCLPAICEAATPDIGAPPAPASCKDGVLLWKGGCACGDTQHDSSNTSLPDWGVCEPQ